MQNDTMRDEGDALAQPISEATTRSELPVLETPFGDAKTLMLAVQHAQDSELPLRGIQVNYNDHTMLATLVEIAFVTRDALTDKLGLSTNGRLFIGLKPEGVLDLPIEVAEVTGNIEESELAARYCESKIAAIDNAITMGQAPLAEMQVSWEESYQHCALTLRAMAQEFRMGLHHPTVHIRGRVIPYNDTNDTGMRHESPLRQFFDDVHSRNVKAGWWSEITTGEPKKRNVGELLILFVTEMAEAYEAWLEHANDDKLPQHPGIGVELADLGIRWADFCGALNAGRIIMPLPHAFNPGDEMFREIIEIAKRYESIRKTPEACGDPETAEFLPAMDVAVMIDEKLAFNAKRPDHKIENRLKEDGKRT
jgi:hypothetical protein